jgi:hypothetical protein
MTSVWMPARCANAVSVMVRWLQPHMPSMWTPLPTFKPRGALARAIWLRPV